MPRLKADQPAIFYALGVGVHWWTRRSKGQTAFARREGILAIVIIAAGAVAAWGLASGWLAF